MNSIARFIEATLFVAEEPVTVKELQKCLATATGLTPTIGEVEQQLQALIEKYHHGDFAFEIVPIAGGYQFLSKPDVAPVAAAYLKTRHSKQLTTSQLETLAIIAYRQPISKPEIERIRGVNCDFAIQKLLEKELIRIVGRSDTVGKPLLYGTSQHFMNHFGINSVDDLPQLRDLEQPTENTIGSPSEN
ncbi:MAG: SMC-Scp complex subunit ScpB [Chitinophagales bacterium]|nr:SMC-Scp complex subunit ScpB [Chitinophagales bacterium]MDW8427762.1 SMC-Scp complex subunit ScpB [Chitinophagales bacterium]